MKNIEHKKPSLVTLSDSVEVKLSYLEKRKLLMIAEARGVSVSDVLRECVRQAIAADREARAEVIAF